MPNETELTVKIRVSEDTKLTTDNVLKIVKNGLEGRRVAGSITATVDTIHRRTFKVRVERRVVDAATIEFSIDEADFQEHMEETGNDPDGFQSLEQLAVDAWMSYEQSADFDIDTLIDKGENREIIDWNWKILEFISGTDVTGPVTYPAAKPTPNTPNTTDTTNTDTKEL
jgi:hypothetical protein